MTDPALSAMTGVIRACALFLLTGRSLRRTRVGDTLSLAP